MLNPTDSGVEARWKAMWEDSPQRSPFSRLEYVAAVARAAGLRVGVVFTSSSAGDTGGAAVTWRRRGPYREVILPPFTPISALLLGDTLSESDVHAGKTSLDGLLEELEGCFHAVHLHLPPSIADVRTAQWRSWSARPLYTYQLASPDRDAWSDGTARNFRSARDGYTLVQGVEFAEAAVRLVSRSYGRHDRTLRLGAAATEELVKTLAAADLASVFGARNLETDEIDAAVVVARSASYAYYWIAGSRPGDAMTVLIGEMLPLLFASGIETFDFVGANTPSIAEFKRRFGATLVPYYRLIHYGRTELKLLSTFRKTFR